MSVKTSIPRIVRVKPKDNSAELYILPDLAGAVQSTYLRDAKDLQDMLNDSERLEGYAVIVWGNSGRAFGAIRHNHRLLSDNRVLPEYLKLKAKSLLGYT